MPIITKEQIQNGADKQAVVGEILVRTYTTALTKKGDEYITGTLLSGIEVPFKVWNNSSAFNSLKREDYSNVIVQIMGSFNEYNNQKSIIVDSIQAIEGYTIDQFLPVKYDANAYWNALMQVMKQKVGEYAYSLADRILFSNEEVSNAFKIEFAAQSHHDNCKSGLLAHTFKVLSNVNYLITTYPKIAYGENRQNTLDMLFLGTLFHDLGKIREMNLGIYQPVSKVTHRYLGAEYIAEYKKEIIEHYDEDWYYNLISIILQHHGEYAEPCKTIYAYIVHKADALDAEFTTLVEGIENPIINSVGESIKIDGSYLSL